MKNRIRIFLTVLCIACLLLSSAGADVAALSGQSAMVTPDGKMQMVLYSAVDGNLDAGEFTVVMNETTLKGESLKALNRTEVGTSWFFILDNCSANGFSKAIVPVAQQLLTDVVGAKDNVAVMTAASVEKTDIVLSSNKAQLSQWIGSMKTDNKNSDLEKAIRNALEFTDEELKPRVAVVVLSALRFDMEPIAIAGLAKEAAKNNATMYVLAFPANDVKAARIDAFAGLASDGCGSLFLSTKQNNDANKVVKPAVQAVVDREALFRVLTVDIRSIKSVPAKITLSLQNAEKAQMAEFELSAEVQQQMQPFVNTAIVTPTPNPDGPTSTPDPIPGPKSFWEKLVDALQGMPWYYFVLVGGGMLLVIVLLIALVMQKKRQRRAAAKQAARAAEEKEEEGSETEIVMSGIELRIEMVNDTGARTLNCHLDSTLIIGREAPSEIIIEGDPKVSRKHAMLSLRKGMIFLSDYSSSNGTYLNERKILSAVSLNPGETIRLGRTNIKVYW